MYHFSGSGSGPSPTSGPSSYQSNGQTYGQPSQAQSAWNPQQYNTAPHSQTQTSHYPQYPQPVSGTYQSQQAYYQYPQQQQYSQNNGLVQSPTPYVGTGYTNSQPVYGAQPQASPIQAQYPAPFQQTRYSVAGAQQFRPPVRPEQYAGISRTPSAPLTASQPPDTCYNCGLTGHWAQNCPEERRAVPAGDLQRAKKRQKSSGTAPTQRSINQPPGQPSLQRGWTHPLANQQSHSFNSPITPLSAYPNITTSGPPQSNAGFQGYQAEQRQSIGFPTPSSSHPSQYSSPVSSAANLLVSNPSPQPQVQVPLAYALPRAQTSPAVATIERPWSQETVTPKIPEVSVVTVDSTAEDDAQEDVLKDLEELDKSVGQHHQGENFLQLSRPLSPVLLSLSSAPPDMSPYGKNRPLTTSKYFKHEGNESYKLPAAERRDWPELRDDPVFAPIPAKCESISFETLVAQRKAIMAENLAQLGVPGGCDVEEQHTESYTTYSSPATVDSANGTLTSEQEMRLAALGVTGSAKPQLKKRIYDDAATSSQGTGLEIDSHLSKNHTAGKKRKWSFQRP